MACRALRIATWISTGCLGFTLVLAIASAWINPWDHHLSISEDFHIGVWGRGWDVRLVFFNDRNYGPYRGSVISLDGFPVMQQELGFGDTAGIYLRYFHWSHETLWTFMLLIWYPTVMFAILPVWQLLRRNTGTTHRQLARR